MKIKSATRNAFRVLALTLLGHLLTVTVQAQVLKPGGNATVKPNVSSVPTPQVAVAGDYAVADIDKEVFSIMTANQIGGASLAIIYNTRLVYAQGYTFAPQGAPLVSPGTFFRQASVSKLITAMSVMQLIAEGKLALSTKMQSVLNVQTADQKPPVSSSFSDITIQDLLEMTSGLDPYLMFSDQAIAAALGKPLPIAPADILSYAAGEQLGATPLATATGATVYLRPPGNKAGSHYNNSDYFVLGEIVAKLRGAKSFAEAIKAPLLDPLNIKRIRSAHSLLSQQLPEEATYDGGGKTAPNVMAASPSIVPVGYGDENVENGGGAGGLSAAAPDMARVLAAMNLAARDVNEKNPIFKYGVYPHLAGNWLSYAYSAFHDPEFTYKDANGNSAFGMYGLDAFGRRTPKQKPPYYLGYKGGQLSASQNAIYFEQSGFGYVINWNGSLPPDGWYPVFTNVLKAAHKHDWGDVDLFPSYGMPSFPGASAIRPDRAALEVPTLSPAQLASKPPSAIKSLVSP